MRFFNTAGPIIPAKHYCVPALARIDVDHLLRLIGQWKYFVLHAPRQTGKTSTLLALRDAINADGELRCVYVNVEVGQSAREDVAGAMRAILVALALAADDERLRETSLSALSTAGPHMAMQETLGRWAESEPKPLVLMIDKIDSLVGDTLLAVLRQLRAGYAERPERFAQSVILCGVRDVRDYRIRSSAEQAIVAGGSAFNVRAESLRLGDFSQGDVEFLLAQHADETGQAFTAEAKLQLWALTEGQPWLVNALAYEACFNDEAGLDRSRTITAKAIQEAREQLIQRRETHLEAGPQLLLQAFLQRIVNSGGRIERENGLGRKRTDLLVVRPVGGRTGGTPAPERGVTQRVVIECKVLHKGRDATRREGLRQTRDYMDRCGAAEGHLVIFDRTEGRSWQDKLYREEATEGGAPVTVWGM